MALISTRRLLTRFFPPLVSSFSTASVKPFEDIPGPRGLPFIGISLDLLRSGSKMVEILNKRVEKYGPIYKEKMFPSFDKLVIVADPKDIEVVFRADGKYPDRPDVSNLFTELRDQLKLNDPPTLFISNGEEWYRQRQPMSQFMSVPRRVGEYYKQFNEISNDLLKYLESKRDPNTGIVFDLLPVLKLWSFESVVYFTLGKRLHALDDSISFPEGQEFINMSDTINRNIMKLIFYPSFIFKTFPNKLWKEALKSQQRMYDIAKGWIEEKQSELDLKDEMPELPDFLTYMLLSGKMTIKEITSNSLDLLMAGIDTTSNTLAWCLYNLATNPHAQDKLRSEIHKVLPTEDEPITADHIHKIRYLNYVVKESLRITPIAIGTLRRVDKDIELSGYKVPAGTIVFIMMTVPGASPTIYPKDTNKFVPERWDREKEGHAHIDKFAHVPFGFGPRMCVGRRVAELELHIAIANIIRNFKIEFPEDKPMKAALSSVLSMEREFNLKLHKL